MSCTKCGGPLPCEHPCKCGKTKLKVAQTIGPSSVLSMQIGCASCGGAAEYQG